MNNNVEKNISWKNDFERIKLWKDDIFIGIRSYIWDLQIPNYPKGVAIGHKRSGGMYLVLFNPKSSSIKLCSITSYTHNHFWHFGLPFLDRLKVVIKDTHYWKSCLEETPKRPYDIDLDLLKELVKLLIDDPQHLEV